MKLLRKTKMADNQKFIDILTTVKSKFVRLLTIKLIFAAFKTYVWQILLNGLEQDWVFH